MDWRHRALCRDEDPELFFPIGTTGPAVVQIEQAKAVCRRCPEPECHGDSTALRRPRPARVLPGPASRRS